MKAVIKPSCIAVIIGLAFLSTSTAFAAEISAAETGTNTNAFSKSNVSSETKPEDKIITAVEKGDFEAALENVYADNPQIKAQREALKATDESAAQAVSGFRPDISASLSKGRVRNGNTNSTWSYDDTKSHSLTVTQPIFSGGSSLAEFKAAKEQVKAARANLAAVEQQVLYNAVTAYTDVVEKKSVFDLNNKNVGVLQKQLDVTNARFKAGELTVTDVSQAKARLAAAQADERQAKGDLEVARASFKRIIGYDAPDKISLPDTPLTLPKSIAEAREIAAQNNPTLIAAIHNEKAAGHNVYAKGATLLPSVNLQGTMSRAEGGSLSLNKLDNDSIKVNVTIPLYQSGAEWSRLRAARNSVDQAKFNSIDANEATIETVTGAWEAYNASKEVIISNQAAVQAAETALAGVRKENEFGVRTILDVLNAEQETFSARVNLVRASRAEKLQAYRLLAAVGKLTGKDLELESKTYDPKEHYDSVKYQLLGL